MCIQFNCSFRHRLKPRSVSPMARLKYAKNTLSHTPSGGYKNSLNGN